MSAPVALLDLRKLPLHFVRCPALNLAHEIGYRKARRDRHKHIHMVSCQHTLKYLDPVLAADLPDYLTYPQSDAPFQFFEPVFGDPHQMIAMVKCAVLAFIVLHNHTLR